MINELLAGRYRIVTSLSSGGFAKTYLAEDTHRPGSPQCVVKHLVPPNNDDYTLQNARRLFQREGEILERLGREHDRLPQLYAYFEENGEFYLIQEYICGHPLTEEIVPGQPLSEDQVLQILADVLEILVFVHGKGVIHRDIKPANLIRRSGDNKLVLIDFGLVKELTSPAINSQGQNTPTVAVGTHGYMPIEQFHGYPQYNSDIYALGMLAIQALMGASASQLLRLRDPNNPNTGEVLWRDRLTNIRPKLANIIDKMVCYDCRHRYQTAAEVIADLRDINSQVRINLNQIKRWFRRPKRLIIGGSALLVFLGLPLIFATQLPQKLKAAHIYNRGVDKSDRKDYQAAVKDFTEALQINPNYAEALSKRCHCHLMLGDRLRAMQDCTQALQVASNFAQAYQAYTNRGIARLSLGDAQGAIADYSQAIQINPKHALAFNNRGQVKDRMGDKEGAIQDFTQAIKVEPKFAVAYLNRCLSRSNAGDHSGGIEDCTQAIKLNPNLVQAYLNRSLVYFRLGNYQKSIEDSNIAIRINAVKNDPDLAKAYHNRGSARMALGDKQGAMEDFNQALRINPKDAGAYYERALIRIALGDKPKAIQDFQFAAKLKLEQGSTQGFKDAQFQIKKLQQQPLKEDPKPQ
jgi:serine/threonine protein kinase/regulator of sirC expression with transglutaminase-like and TPR domain